MGHIVVGVDGSDDARRAVEWAVDEARARGWTIRLVHSWEFPKPSPSPDGGLAPVDFEGVANRVLDEAAEAVPDDVTVEREVANDNPAQALIRCSQQAELVVVGSRGIGGFKGLLLGSVSSQVVNHAQCPVVVVPKDDRAG